MDLYLKEDIINFLKKRDGDYALYYRDLKTDEKIEYNSNEIFPAASIIKIPIMVEFFRQLEADLLKRDELITIPETERVDGAGILHELREDIEMRLGELILLMITLSDNTATNLIIDRLGREKVNQFLFESGYKTRLKRKMMDFAARKEGKENLTSVKEIGSLLKDIYRGEIDDLSKKSCQEMISIMSKQVLRDKISFYIPEDNWDKVASKTGTLDGIEHDASIFDLIDKKFVLVIMSKNLPTNAYGNVTIAQTAKMIYGI